ncbi:MAG: UDP-glucose 4-epimerase GalE [Elusimicrobiota bacterium]
MADESILVVGGAGYIGSQCAKELKKAGFEPVVLDNLCTGYRDNVRWGPFIEGDIGDSALLDEVFSSRRFAGVMHFAAHALVGESMENPGKYYRNNVAATLNLLQAMVRAKTANFIFSSTCAVYGEPEQVPLREDHPRRPINPYGRSKLMVEEMLQDFDAAYGLRYSALRYFNAAGADPEGETGEAHDPETHIIPLAIQAALGRRAGLKVFGADYDTPDGTCLRDYIHTVDLSAAHILALRRLLDGGASAAYNLGNEEGRSVLEVIAAVKKASGKDFKVEQVERRPGDPARLIGSSAKIKQELGWSPRYGELETMVRTAWDWAQRR